jgi:apolipoprotein N-acyltransferase
MLYALAGVEIGLWPVAIAAPLPILAATPEMSTRLAARCAFFAYFLGNLAIWPAETFAVPLWELAVIHGAGAVAFAIIVVLHCEATRRFAGALAALAYPVLTAAFWHGLGAISPHGSWDAPAIWVSTFLPLMQLTAVTGLAGVNFLIAWLPAAIAIAWYRRRWRMGWNKVATIPLGAFVIVSAIGAIRLVAKDSGASIKVGLGATDKKLAASFSVDPADAADVLLIYAPIVQRLAAEGAQVVVLPEKIAGVGPKYESGMIGGFAQLARMNRVWLVAGLNRIAPAPMRNLAVVVSPTGDFTARYYKHHLVPGLESGYAPGTELAAFELPQGEVAVAICKDLDFPSLGREIAKTGARFLFVPAWDWPGSEEIHARMAIAFGIESGLSIARAARQGLLTVSDSRGRIIAHESTFKRDSATVVAAMPPGCGATFYARHGDWFGNLTILLAAIIIALLTLSVRLNPSRV